MPGEKDDRLLAQLAALQSGAADVDAAAMLREHADPRVRMLAQLWAQNRAEEDDAPSEPPSSRSRPAPQRARRQARLRRKLDVLTEELEWLQDVNDTLAAALGACALCWGEDRRCEECDGDGAPGWDEPEPELFAEFVAPAIQRMRESESRRARAPARGPRSRRAAGRNRSKPNTPKKE